MIYKKNRYLKVIILILILFFYHLNADIIEVNVSGKVQDKYSNPIPNAKISYIHQEKHDTTTTFSAEDGTYSITLFIEVDEDTIVQPDTSLTFYHLYQNYPNPFTGTTTIKFTLHKKERVNISVYNVLGQKIKELANKIFPEGTSTVNWNCTNSYGQRVSAGVYICSLKSKSFSKAIKMLYLGNDIVLNVAGIKKDKQLVHPVKSIRKQKSSMDTTAYFTIVVDDSSFPEYREPYFEIDLRKDNIVKNLILQEINQNSLWIVERDMLFNSLTHVYNFHHLVLINKSSDTLIVEREALIPDSLNKQIDVLSRKFGLDAFIPTDYASYFYIPEYDKLYVANEPDYTDGIHYWKNILIAPNKGYHIPYSNYYGEGPDLFVKELGINQYLNLEIKFNFSIKKNSDNPSLLDLKMQPILSNTSNDTLFKTGFLFHVPRNILLKNGSEIKLYNLISDTLEKNTDNIELFYYNKIGRGDGFGNLSFDSQEIVVKEVNLYPGESYSFTYSITIEPLRPKFVISPVIIVYYEALTKRIWPADIITIKNMKYEGRVHYLSACNLAIQPYILFSINGDELKIVSPNEIEDPYPF